MEGIVAIFAILSLWIVWILRGKFLPETEGQTIQQLESGA
jgi:hypothetical protein